MTTREEQELRREEAVYMHDFVRSDDEDVVGTVVGIKNDYGEALIHTFEGGKPTMNIKSVDRETLEHYDGGRL